ncbi:hypothetical protein [Burkholderia sp. Leaf177]|uniref:hypothetical protein n=1 Tax=Burkholderia sp. Leaf177 TaxID=1736287 RepID=UPI0012E3EB63|nr:hypothetical protein [Burkholderia sp. Leaf177]
MKTSALIQQLTDVMNALGDPVVVVPSYVENRYEALERVEITTMVLCTSEKPNRNTNRYRTRYAAEPVSAAIVLRGSR